MSDLKFKNIALLYGGISSEREVSLSTGRGFMKALDQLGVRYTAIDAGPDLMSKLIDIKPDMVLLALHGRYAEDGVVQGICEYLKIPYSGCGVLTSALCMNKALTKQIFLQNGVPTAPFQKVEKSQYKKGDFQLRIATPLVVKPSREGSSVGVFICQNQEEVFPAIEKAFAFDSELVVESFIKGKEVAMAVVEGKALTSVEIQPKQDFYSYENKYTSGKTDYFLPARLSEACLNRLKDVSEAIYKIFNIHSYCRIDFIVDKNEDIFCLEINTLPGMTPTSLLPKAAQYDGMTFEQLISRLINTARTDYSEEF